MIRALSCYSLIFVFLFCALKSFASYNDIGSGTLLLETEGSPHTKWVAPTLNTRVDIDVSGPIVRAALTQTFSNPGKEWAQATYVFPLPETAAVDRLLMKVGERIIEGEIKEKQQAKQIFEAAKKSGRKASLVSQQRENLFVTSIANIPPGESIEVTIEYQHPVDKQGDIYSLRFPMTITPRYMPGSALSLNPESEPAREEYNAALSYDLHGQGNDNDGIFPPWAEHGTNKNSTTLAVTLRPGFKLNILRSLFHQVTETQEGENLLRLTLNESEHGANRDFILQWSPEPDYRPQVELFSEGVENRNEWEDYHLLMVTPPSPELTAPPPSREVIFVLDTSGSMGGESIRQAKRALSWSLDRLRSSDRFNIIEFNSGSWNLFGSSQTATTRNLTRAKEFVSSLKARGGTEMKPALEAALCGFCARHESLRQVIFITDGAIGNEAELFRVIKGKLGNSRLFTVGIGSAPNTFFMRKAAEAGRGTYTYIGDIAKAGEAMAALFLTMESPMLTNIRVSGVKGAQLNMFPSPVPDVYAGRSMILLLKGPLPRELKIEGDTGGKKWLQTLDSTTTLRGKGIRTLWARNRIESLMDKYRFSYNQEEKDQIRQDIVDTALDHHLVSAFTSLVAVEKTVSRPADASGRQHVLANNSPLGTRFGLTATATNSETSILAGMSLLIIALILAARNSNRRQGRRIANEA